MSQADDEGQHTWKRSAWDVREATTEALVAIPPEYPRTRSVLVSEEHEFLHKYLFEYYAAFEPKRDDLGYVAPPGEGDEAVSVTECEEWGETLWTERLLSVAIPERYARVRLDGPEASIVRSQQSDREVLSAVYGDLPTRDVAIRLQGLREFWQLDNTVTITAEGWVENQGHVERTLRPALHLPVAACVAVRAQLDHCLDRYGWLPDLDDSTDIIRGFDQSGEEPQGEYQEGEYTGDPDL